MKAGKYSIKELFNNRNVEQVVIPEIQRDYVWGKKEVEGLLKSIHEDYQNFEKGIEGKFIANIEDEIGLAFEQFYKKQRFSCNIGFIYAYNDPEYSGKYFLIDGQQRLTTIYLLLLFLASENKEFRNKFEKLYMLSNAPVIDYRVREASHYFLKEVVTNYKDHGISIEDQSWYFKEYSSDKTIKSITTNINTIREFVLKNNLVVDDFINYVQDYIEFWYFDTNISEQGEELYIYMNARGEQMQENENLKADLLGKIELNGVKNKQLSEIKNEWGTKWEEWQQFFWLNRKKNDNADNGFNEFINCVAGLENYLGKNGVVYTKEDFEGDERGKKYKFSYSDILDSFSNNGLSKIEGYTEGLNYLFKTDNIERFKSHYQNVTWVEECLAEFIDIFNSDTTNWFADHTDPNRGLEHSKMVFIWSLLHYMNTRKNTTSNNEIFRVLRLYYIRFKNYNRSVQSIDVDIKNIHLYTPWKIAGTEEENSKHEWFSKKVNPDNIYQFEEIIWSVEDHPLNMIGRDLKAINCSHLIDFNSEPSLIELTTIKNKFFELFPENSVTSNYKKIVTILLFYGEFWERVSPWYCLNYYFGNWKKIIRNIDTKDEVFRMFFNDFKSKNLDEIYQDKVVEFEIDKQTTSFIAQLKWYATKINEKIWQQGFYIVVEHYNYPDNDAVFINAREIVNTKGDFKGGNPQVLSELL